MIELSIYESSHDFAKGKRSFCKRFDMSDLVVPFNSIIDTFRVLYGSKVVVQFTVML